MLKKHAFQRHQILEENLVPVFKDSEGERVVIPDKKELLGAQHVAYIAWLAGLTERIISVFHPRLPGTYK